MKEVLLSMLIKKYGNHLYLLSEENFTLIMCPTHPLSQTDGHSSGDLKWSKADLTRIPASRR